MFRKKFITEIIMFVFLFFVSISIGETASDIDLENLSVEELLKLQESISEKLNETPTSEAETKSEPNQANRSISIPEGDQMEKCWTGAFL